MTSGPLTTAEVAPAPTRLGTTSAWREVAADQTASPKETRSAGHWLRFRTVVRAAWRPVLTCVLIALGFATHALYPDAVYDFYVWYARTD